MSELDKLRDVFVDGCIVSDNCLKERFADGSCMTRQIDDIDSYSTLIVRIDPDIRDPFPYFGMKVEGIKSMCDYFIFVELSDCIYAFAVELKKGSICPRPQLLYANEFVAFLVRRLALNSDYRLEKPVYMRLLGVSDVPHRGCTKIGNSIGEFDETNYHKRYHERGLRLDTLIRLKTNHPTKGLISP